MPGKDTNWGNQDGGKMGGDYIIYDLRFTIYDLRFTIQCRLVKL